MNIHDVRELIIPFATLIFSWPVIVMVIVILFRHRLQDLLKCISNKFEISSIKKAELGVASVEFYEPKTVETSIGKTNVSAISTHFETDSFVFRCRRFGFEISYPLGGEWVPDFDPTGEIPDFLSKQGQILVVSIVAENEIEGFKPNINVIVQPVADVTITQYVAESIKQFTILKYKIISHEIDETTNGASFSYSQVINNGHNNRKINLLYISRVTLKNGLAFITTTTIIEGSPLPLKIRKQLNAMLNSFKVISFH